MRLIKPYGRSVTTSGKGGNGRVTRQFVSKKETSVKSIDVLLEEDKLILAHWISMIDKIIRKPKQKTKSDWTRARFRKLLGNACWEVLRQKDRISKEGQKTLRPVWDAKISPYEEVEKEAEEKAKLKLDYLKGRWFKVFLSEEHLKARGKKLRKHFEQAAQKIDEHLYVAQYNQCGNLVNHSLHEGEAGGVLAHRAKAIRLSARNIGEKKSQLPAADYSFEQAHFDEYAKKVNLAAQKIFNAAKAKRDRKPKPMRFLLSEAMAILSKEGWPQIFGADVTTMKAAEEKAPHLLALHCLVKEYYKRLLGQKSQKNLSVKLPKTGKDLVKNVRNFLRNRQVSRLIYTGKILHYTALSNEQNATILDGFPTRDAYKESVYHTSAGQQHIKRAENFVRLWRVVLVHAAQTLEDWVDPKGEREDKPKPADILIKRMQDIVLKESWQGIDEEKKELLFAGRLSDIDERALRTFCFKVLTPLRNGSFHFRDPKSFVAELTKALTEWDASTEWDNSKKQDVKDSLCNFYQQAKKQDRELLEKAFIAAKVPNFFSVEKCEKIFAEGADCLNVLPLPRFSKVMARRRDAWPRDINLKGAIPSFPKEQVKMQESLAYMCQYFCLNRLYENGFHAYLRDVTAEQVAENVKKVLSHTTKAAQKMNGKGQSQEAIDLIQSKVQTLLGENWGQKLNQISQTQGKHLILSFLETLTRETAQEFGVQSHYDSNKSKAREQSSYLEKFKQDMVLWLFQEYLEDKKLSFIAQIGEAEAPAVTSCGWQRPEMQEPEKSDEDIFSSEAALFTILHLVPVEVLNNFLQQLIKWDILCEKSEPITGEVQAPFYQKSEWAGLIRVIRLYIRGHDAKYTRYDDEEWAHSDVSLPQFVKDRFCQPQDLAEIFNPQTLEITPRTDLPPLRDLRELNRFGRAEWIADLATHMPKITHQDVVDFQKLQKTIAQEQRQYAKEHERLVRAKNISEKDIVEHKKSAQKLSEYRFLKQKLYLQDEVQLYRLGLEILARLCDYSGLWERDVYFLMLGLCQQKGKTVEGLFGNMTNGARRGIRRLFVRGQIVQLLLRARSSDEDRDEIQNYFTANGETFTEIVEEYRNKFAHFDMLRGSGILNLTDQMNDARALRAYDRKFKNVVAQSIRDLVAKYGIDLSWSIETKGQKHCLKLQEARVQEIFYLKNKGKRSFRLPKQSDNFRLYVARLFGQFSQKD